MKFRFKKPRERGFFNSTDTLCAQGVAKKKAGLEPAFF